MVRHDHPGLFIAFEGLGGSGAAMLSRLLANSLEKEGYRVHHTTEPTTGMVGSLIRAHLTDEWRACPDALQLLFTADRAQHLEKDILPALTAGKIVITNRYAFSSVAYGSLEVGDTEWLKQLNSRFILPDLTFIIQVRPKICALRLKENHYEIELYRQEQKLAKVWSAYEVLSREYSGIHIVNGERGEVEIVRELKGHVMRALVGEPASGTDESSSPLDEPIASEPEPKQPAEEPTYNRLQSL